VFEIAGPMPRLEKLRIAIAGAGIAGLALARLLSREDAHEFQIFDRRSDLEGGPTPYSGRSVNFTISSRGRQVLQQAGLWGEVLPHSVELSGRSIHLEDGSTESHPYGSQPSDVLHAIRREDLHRILLQSVQNTPGISFFFDHEISDVDGSGGRLHFSNASAADFDLLIGSDGAFSKTAETLSRRPGVLREEQWSEWVYKEFLLSEPEGCHLELGRHALHLWPRGNFLICAIPNPDGSWVANLIYRASLQKDLPRYVELRIPELARALSDLPLRIESGKTSGILHTRVSQWAFDDRAILIGDACHAVSPFLGQGMNAALEDAAALTQELHTAKSLGQALASFQELRKPDTDALWPLSEAHLLNLSQRYGSRWHLSGLYAERALEKLTGGKVRSGYSRIVHSPQSRYRFARGRVPGKLPIQLAHFLSRPFHSSGGFYGSP
jgi:kynurenine 3-monooxygenase